LRKQKAKRSSAIPDSPLAPAINNCSNFGITPRAVLPRDEELIGSSRQPKTTNPSSAAIAAISFWKSKLWPTNAIPVA
jgi:hypothetical protein